MVLGIIGIIIGGVILLKMNSFIKYFMINIGNIYDKIKTLMKI